jgi:superfamily II DNA helicase RecQ
MFRRVQACRPAYTSLWRTIERWGSQVVACTATASAQVQRDIQECLHMRNPRCIRMEVVRSNLHICISSKGNIRQAELSLARLVKGSSSKTVLVFCGTRSDCERTAQVLVLNNVSAEAYHSQMDDREGVERRVHAGAKRKLCCCSHVAG